MSATLFSNYKRNQAKSLPATHTLSTATLHRRGVPSKIINHDALDLLSSTLNHHSQEHTNPSKKRPLPPPPPPDVHGEDHQPHHNAYTSHARKRRKTSESEEVSQ
mmetsp:Transcript_561/g.2035  ORF Transcript_561/g.2035 Transcript_561/m.2035 type:complete len:105 (-) Transcript_561:2236-2550(-)